MESNGIIITATVHSGQPPISSLGVLIAGALLVNDCLQHIYLRGFRYCTFRAAEHFLCSPFLSSIKRCLLGRRNRRVELMTLHKLGNVKQGCCRRLQVTFVSAMSTPFVLSAMSIKAVYASKYIMMKSG